MSARAGGERKEERKEEGARGRQAGSEGAAEGNEQEHTRKHARSRMARARRACASRPTRASTLRAHARAPGGRLTCPTACSAVQPQVRDQAELTWTMR